MPPRPTSNCPTCREEAIRTAVRRIIVAMRRVENYVVPPSHHQEVDEIEARTWIISTVSPGYNDTGYFSGK